jgi:hypothetical protein
MQELLAPKTVNSHPLSRVARKTRYVLAQSAEMRPIRRYLVRRAHLADVPIRAVAGRPAVRIAAAIASGAGREPAGVNLVPLREERDGRP